MLEAQEQSYTTDRRGMRKEGTVGDQLGIPGEKRGESRKIWNAAKDHNAHST